MFIYIEWVPFSLYIIIPQCSLHGLPNSPTRSVPLAPSRSSRNLQYGDVRTAYTLLPKSKVRARCFSPLTCGREHFTHSWQSPIVPTWKLEFGISLSVSWASNTTSLSLQWHNYSQQNNCYRCQRLAHMLQALYNTGQPTRDTPNQIQTVAPKIKRARHQHAGHRLAPATTTTAQAPSLIKWTGFPNYCVIIHFLLWTAMVK